LGNAQIINFFGEHCLSEAKVSKVRAICFDKSVKHKKALQMQDFLIYLGRDFF